MTCLICSNCHRQSPHIALHFEQKHVHCKGTLCPFCQLIYRIFQFVKIFSKPFIIIFCLFTDLFFSVIVFLCYDFIQNLLPDIESYISYPSPSRNIPISIAQDGRMIVGHKNSQDLTRESL